MTYLTKIIHSDLLLSYYICFKLVLKYSFFVNQLGNVELKKKNLIFSRFYHERNTPELTPLDKKIVGTLRCVKAC